MPHLLKTKIHPPRRRPNVVERQRLFDKLDAGRWQKLSLLLGPAGSGKSTLISEWLHHLDIPWAWLSLDELDDDPGRFAAYLIAALRTAATHVGEGADALLASPGKLNFEAAVESLILMPLSEDPLELVLVLDDFHFIRNRDIYLGLRQLLRHTPSGMHLVISSRVAPRLGLSSLRVRGELNEVKAEDLRFEKREALLFYNQTMGLGLEMEQVKAIEQHTEGWAAAIQMAALRLKDGVRPDSLVTSLTNQRGLVSEYLLQEVFAKQSPSLKDFLLTVSILDRMCDPLCRVLTNSKETPSSLEVLACENLFLVPLDDEGRWYRLNHLLRGLLRAKLEERSPEQLGELHKKASLWFEEDELLLEAGDHAMASSDPLFLADLIERQSSKIISLHGFGALSRWLEEIPDDHLEARPILAVLKAWCAVIVGEMSAAETQLRRAQEIVEVFFKNAKSGEDPLQQILDNEIDAIRAITAMLREEYETVLRITETAFEKLSEGSPLLKRARSRLNLVAGRAQILLGDFKRAYGLYESAERDSLDTGILYNRFQVVYGRTICMIQQGHLTHAYRLCQEALDLAKEKQCSLSGPMGDIHLNRGLVHMYRNEPEPCLRELERAVEIYRLTSEQHSAPFACVLQALAKRIIADEEGVREALERTMAMLGRTPNKKLRRWVEGFQMAVELRGGDLTHYQSWRDSLADFKPSPAIPDQDTNCFMADMLIYRGEAKAALETAEHSYNYAQQYNQHLFLVRAGVLKAGALALDDKVELAIPFLEQAIERAIPERLRIPFYMIGDVLRPLLPSLGNAAAKEFLAAAISGPCEGTSNAQAAVQKRVPWPDSGSAVVESLSPRELEVLALIAEGRTNSQIAKELYVALGTVKTHAHNILSKLDARSRTQAVKIAQDMNLFQQRQMKPRFRCADSSIRKPTM